ncbi:phosphonopyruvate decarboxylase [Planctomycetales bacterium]|nr:phosphonopyruvate decarboxylase [Planctomycetales bacterium]
MIAAKDFYNALRQGGIEFFFGVPDSLLRSFCAYLTDTVPKENHIITANEGAAVGLAAGVYLATRRPALVYMQNSGQGNAVNPLASLTDPNVYGIPVLLLVGWRGEPGMKDEPQHIKQGEITLSLFDTLGIPYDIIPDDQNAVIPCIEKAFQRMQQGNTPYALIVRKDLFEPYTLQNVKPDAPELLTREAAIQCVAETVQNNVSDAVFVSTTGMTSRELYEYRTAQNQSGAGDFLTVGSMGHASAIALGIAKTCPARPVFCLDGDGAVLMHLGTLTTIGTSGTVNFKHILLNNGAHDSVGGQPTCGLNVDFCTIAQASGYQKTLSAKTSQEIHTAVLEMLQSNGPVLLEIRIKKGARKDLGRPKSTPPENKKSLMDYLTAFCNSSPQQ